LRGLSESVAVNEQGAGTAAVRLLQTEALLTEARKQLPS
jgi:hypothetical protein